MFTITIENLLRFHEYFDNKTISMKNFPLDFEKVRSTHISCGFFAQMWKDLQEKRSSNILRHLESCHVASECLVRSRSPHSKNVIIMRCMHKWIAFDCAAVKQQKKT